jgi:hypothetical protein
MIRVYISSTKDVVSIAQKLAESLRARDFWVLLPARDTAFLLPQIRDADAFLVLIGPKFERSTQLESEWVTILEETSGLTKKLIPLRVGSAKLPTFLRRWEDLRIPPPDNEGRWSKFIDVIVDALNPEKKLKLKPPLKADVEARQRRMDEIAAFAEHLRAQGM